MGHDAHYPKRDTRALRLLKLSIAIVCFAWDQVFGTLRRLVCGPGAGRCVVLCYHAVRREDLEGFRGQMDLLIQLTSPVPPAYRGALAAGERYSSVTFDDGFQSAIVNGLPILRERKIPSIVFVPTAKLGKKPDWVMHSECDDTTQTIVSAEELRVVPSDLVAIGSHTQHHIPLSNLDDREIRSELDGSKSYLESHLRQPIENLALPYGAHDERILALCRESGYRRVFLVTGGATRFGADEFAVERIMVEPADSLFEFRLKLVGAYRWMPFASRLKRKLSL